MQVKQLLLRLKQIGVDITSLKNADAQILEKITAIESQLGEGGSIESRLEALQEAIRIEFAEADEAVKTEIKKITDALGARITALETALEGKADADHRHSADDIDETAEKQFVSEAKKTQYDENTVYTNEMATVNSLGGIAAGTTFNNMPVNEVLTKLLYPYVAPTVSATGTPNGGTYEKGNNQTITNVKAVVTKKSEKITKVEVLDGSSQLAVKEGTEVQNGGTFNFPVSVAVPSVNKQLTVKITDAANKTYSASTGSFNFVYPYYMGVCAEDATIDEALVEGLTKKIEGKGNKSHSFTCNNQRMVFAYPKSHGVLKTIIDPNGFDNFGSFGRQEVSITGLDGTAQTYYVYVNSASTVSNFTMKFNY